jgi:inorganic triphosphatase YgiF
VRAKEHIASLNEAYSHVRSQDLVELRSHVEALKSSAERYLRDHQNRAAKIENSQIKNIDDIDLLLGELRTLLGIFDGCQKDLNNFATYEKWLKRFDEDVKRLNDTSLGPSEFNRLAKSMAKNAKASQTDDDELPWDVEETYETLVTAMEAKHGKAAGEWIREHVPTKKNISALEPREAQRLKLFLQSFPAFLSKEQVKKVDDALNDCDARLDDLQVDGLVAKFESLSDPAKREFLKRAQNLMGKN